MSSDLERCTAVARTFLNAVFGDLEGAFIEIRVIEEKTANLERRPEVLDRKWYDTVEGVVEDLPRLGELAAAKTAAIFFGVLARKARGQGKAGDTLPGVVAWCDIDFKDFAGGEEEARRRLAELPIPPSIVVRSGHGLHAYWLLREPEDPSVLSSLSKALATALGGDHAFDAARILRLPGTLNRKEPTAPLPVEIEVFEPDRTYNRSEIEEALEMVAPAEDPSAPNDEPADPEGDLDPRILAILDCDRHVKALFDGTGKPEVNEKGRELDKTSSGYDFSLALALVRKGVRDTSLLANAVRNRPDGVAALKGERHVTRTVEAALTRLAKSVSSQVDFEVERVRIFDSCPPVYELTIKGQALTCSSAELRSKPKFATIFMDALRRIPAVPQKTQDWEQLVNQWLADAEIVEQPPEASEEFAVRERIQQAIEDLPVGEERADLDRARALELETHGKVFKVDSILRVVQEQHPAVTRQDVCRHLRGLGCESVSTTVDEGQVRVWKRLDGLYTREEKEAS